MSAKKTHSTIPTSEDPAPLARAVVPRSISEEMRQSYLNYAMTVITSRALPDVRDGLKPVHRRILYTMHKMGLHAGAKFRKSAAVTGDVLGKFHPHGDMAVYDAMVKMAQDFTMRYPLIWGQGNWGSLDGDNAAAMRYTECKMTRLSGSLLGDIEKETVDWRPNYDGTQKEPVVLPAAFPNLLANGTLGIAVGMATNIPPHNLSEILDASVRLVENPDISQEELFTSVRAPDFPTGGVIYNEKEIRHAYATGKGPMVVRGEAEIVEDKKGAFSIIITSIPYRVNKADLITKMAELVQEKKVEGIRDIRDESTKDVRIVVELKNGSQPEKVLNYLYKHTSLEDTFHLNMVALVDGVPRTLSLKGVLEAFLAHKKEVVRKRSEFELAALRAREHILEGLVKALDHIDAIIKTIKAAKDVPTAHSELMKKFKFSDLQASAILEMKLQKLAGLERKKLEDELKEVRSLIKGLEEILKNPKKMAELIRNELLFVKEKFGDERRTKVVKGGIKAFNVEDIIAEEENVLVLTKGGYVKRTNPDEYKRQKRGGVGVVDLNTKEEDVVTHLLGASTHDDLLFFTNRGRVYQIKMYDVPEGKRATRGKSIMNVLSLTSDESVTSVVRVPKGGAGAGKSFMLVTEGGVAKKVAADAFADVRRSGIIAITLKDDSLVAAELVEKGESVFLVTAKGQSIRFKESDIREMGRAASGVRAMRLSKGDKIISADIADAGGKGMLLVVSLQGFGKKTPLKEFKIQKRGGSGIKASATTAKTGSLIGASVLPECEDAPEEMVVVSQKGQVIRTGLDEVSTSGRATQGVRIMKLRDGDKVASLVCL